MSKEPVPPYHFQSPPFNGATHQHQPDRQTSGVREVLNAASNGSSSHRVEERDPERIGYDVDGFVEQPKPSLFDQFWARFKPVSLAKDEGGSGHGSGGDSGESDDGASGVVHSIIKKTDYWFDREVFTLERDTRKEAASWAAQGLPRHDLNRVDPLEIELVLAGRCVELFRQWVGRVRTKMKDAIATEAEGIGSQLASLQAATDRLHELRGSTRSLDEDMATLIRKESEEHPPLGFEPIVRNRLFFPSLAVLLVAVEFLANFPLFRLLLPLHSALANAANEAAQNVGDQWWAGLALWWKMAAWHVEAFVVALAVVVVLVVFGKALGQSARLLLALRAKDHPLAGGSIRSSRRQSWAVVMTCVAGASLVISALFLARSQIAIATAERVATDSRNIDSLQSKIQAARGDIGQVSSYTQRVRDAERTLAVHRDDYGYAETVQGNNGAILLLNVGLVLAAALVGFLACSFKLTNQFGADPRIAELRVRRHELEKEVREQLSAGYAAVSSSVAGVGRVEHLIRSSPLDQWPAKARRLEAIIPMFRADNARLRGMDSASILSFRQPPPLELPTFEAEQAFPEPADFAALKDAFYGARHQFYNLAGAQATS
jgi:hypothetical protein